MSVPTELCHRNPLFFFMRNTATLIIKVLSNNLLINLGTDSITGGADTSWEWSQVSKVINYLCQQVLVYSSN